MNARDIASLVQGELEGPETGPLTNIKSLDQARSSDLSFLASRRYLSYFQRSSAGAVLLTREFRAVSGGPATRIVVNDTHAALVQVMSALLPEPEPAWGVHPEARLGRGTRWQGRVSVGPGSVVGAGVTLGADCVIGPFATIGDNVRLGGGCHIESHAVVHSGVVLGHGVTIRAGARVGGPGFGFAHGAAGHDRIPHHGGCVLEDGVDVGSNSTIDRGSVTDTVIGAGTKIDSQVHVGHNVRIGARCLLMAQVGIGGSTDIGADAVLAGQAGVAGQLTIGAGARIGAQAGVIGNVEAGAEVSGYPARHHRDVLRQAAALRRLAPLVDSLERITEPDGVTR